MAIIVLEAEAGYPDTDIVVHGKTFSLRPEEAQGLHISLSLDCKDPNCPCRIAGREEGQVAGYKEGEEAGYGVGQIAGYEEGQEAPKGKDHR